MNISVLDRFLKYVSVGSQSDTDSATVPSTPGQTELARLLAGELKDMGAQAELDDDSGIVYASIPSNVEGNVPVIGWVAHVDTAPGVSGSGVKPRIVRSYDGGDILLNPEQGMVLSPAVFPELADYLGQDLVVTDGTTLLGADDKAGVAEIMDMAASFLLNPERPHGEIRIAFTPDEEIGRGTDAFDVARFGADFAYTVDGGALGEIEYENFNAASAVVTVRGSSIHPGSAKGRMLNACLVLMEFQGMLPAFQNPAFTEGYEGFYHLDSLRGDVERAAAEYLIRDHDRAAFERKKEFMQECAALLNRKYGEGTVKAEITDSYYNMKEKMLPHMHLVEHARRAMEAVGVRPEIVPVRGGTDGARLSFMGLPCPNLCAGGHNFHGKYEYVPVRSLEKISRHPSGNRFRLCPVRPGAAAKGMKEHGGKRRCCDSVIRE